MNSDIQREAMAALADIWGMSPDVRRGHLMAHLGFPGEVQFGRGLGYIDDDELPSVVRHHRQELVARAASESSPPAEHSGAA